MNSSSLGFRLKSFLRPVFIAALGAALAVAFAVPAFAQIARYDFEGNLNDSAGPYHATVEESPSDFVPGYAGQALELQLRGVLSLPVSLSQRLLQENSFQVDLQSRLTDGNFFGILFSAGRLEEDDPLRGAGVRLIQEYEHLSISLSDGTEDGFSREPLELPIQLRGWNEVSLLLSFELGFYAVQVNGVALTRKFPEHVDVDRLRAAVSESPMSLSGIAGADVEPWSHWQQFDEVVFNAPAELPVGEVNDAFSALQDDLEGFVTLSADAREAHFETLQALLFTVPFEEIEGSLFAYTEAYERLNPPLYQDGRQYHFEDLPLHARVLQFSQDHVFQTQYVPGKLHSLVGVVFEAHEVAPGAVPVGAPRVDGIEARVNGSYRKDPAAELTDQERVVRPTGAHAVPGRMVTIRVPEAVTDKGLSVIVGAHFRNMDYDYIGAINRFPDISVEYPLDKAEIRVLSPFGGGVYLKVPEGTSGGWFTMVIDNAIEAPYFSWRAGRKTNLNDWLAIVAESDAPWADFESDKFMFTIPTDLIRDVNNPGQIMQRWDDIMDAMRRWSGRSLDRPRAEYYSFDTRLVTPAYGAGYPVIIPQWELRSEEEWNPLKVLDFRPHNTLMHEMGHNHLDPTLDFGSAYGSCHFIEAESIVHMLAMAVNDMVYGMGKDEAFAYSGIGGRFTFEEAAFDWIISSNFRNNLPMLWDLEVPLPDQHQLHYQPRSWAKFGDIARLFGWEGSAAVGAEWYEAGQAQPDDACEGRPFIVRRDDYIEKASKALGVNMAPLFHFWGIIPSPPLAQRLAATYPPSPEIRALIESYRDNVAPKNRADYEAMHRQVYDRMDYQKPRYTHYLETFDAGFAQQIAVQFDYLLATYFDVPAPSLPTPINAGMNDAWFNPETPGQGVFINVFPETGSIFLGWFTYDTDGRQNGGATLGDSGHRWLTAIGPFDGHAAFLDATVTRNGAFDDDRAVRRDYYGDTAKIALTFQDCRNATLTYEIVPNGQRSSIPLQRVVNDNVDFCERLAAGDEAVAVLAELPGAINAAQNDAWYDPSAPGQGFFFNAFPETGLLFMGWFTFDVDGAREGDAVLGDAGHRWLTGIGPIEGNRAVLDITLTRGGVFDASSPVTDSAAGSQGTVVVTFDDCARGTVSYAFVEENKTRTITIERVVKDNVPLCEAIAGGLSN
ncbi:MAG: M60 family metallopeptidase [Pseudomonadota bacterium]